MPKLQLKKFKARKRTSEKLEEKAMKASISYVLSKKRSNLFLFQSDFHNGETKLQF